MAAESREENEKEDAPEREAEPEETAEEAGGPEASAAEEPDWLEEHGLSITPQGEFTLTYLVCERVGMEAEVMGTESETANITVTETIENGCKKIEAVLNCDFTGLQKYDGADRAYGIFCFDRYTGIAMPYTFDLGYFTSFEENMDEERGKEITEGNVAYTMHNGLADGIKITVFCPEDYDGAVFGVQCYSFENVELYNNFNQVGSSRIGDENGLDLEPYLDDDSVFFSASNE